MPHASDARPMNAPDRVRVMNEAIESRLRLQTAIRLRWLGVGGQLLTVAFVAFLLGFTVPVGICLVFVALSAWLNVFLSIRYPVRYRLSTRFATALLAYDIFQLAALLYLTGGIENPFAFLLVVPVTVSAATLPPRNTVMLGLLAVVASILLVFYHWPLPWYPGAGFVLPPVYKWGVLACIGAGMAFLALYAYRLSKEGRQMSAALAATEHILAREQQLHALDGLAAAAAHELGTPLGTITVVAKELGREVPPGSPISEDLALLQSQAVRCREILQKLTRRPSEPDPMHARLSVQQLIQEAAAPHMGHGAKVTISARPADGAAEVARPEPIGLRRPGIIYGLGNLIENAVDFAESRVDITAVWSERTITLTIADDGPGFPADIMESLGEPYVTTRPARGVDRVGSEPTGLGLGFFIAKTLIERSGAEVALANRPPPEHGAIVKITWSRTPFEEIPEGMVPWTAQAGARPMPP
jgi:two-component system, sensor histidine kinase RegB